jgi:hypothetical protein
MPGQKGSTPVKMNRFFAALLAVAALGIGAAAYLGVTSTPAHAITVPYSQQPRIGFYQEAGLNVAAGAVINSPVYDMSKVSECTILADNSGGGVARNLVANWLANDGTTVVYSFTTVVAIATRGILSISPTASTASLPATVVAVPAQTGKKMSFTLSAAGAAVGSLVIICQ